jgi:hypothetical protein
VNDKREENLSDFNDSLFIYHHLSTLLSFLASSVLFSEPEHQIPGFRLAPE